MNLGDLHNPEAARKVIADARKRFGKKTCLAPDRTACSGPIVAAHTLSAEAMLRPISRAGYVYMPSYKLIRAPQEDAIDFRLKGIRDTSVFNGFCAHHDKQLFAPIEDQPFVCSPEQLFLHAFRAVAKESYLKRSQADTTLTHEQIANIHGLPEDAQTEVGHMMELHQAVAAIGAEEIETLKARLDKIYCAQDWSRLVSTIIPFKKTPTVVANFVYDPDFDFDGGLLQDLEDLSRPLDHLMITITPSGAGGFALLSHLDDAGAAPRCLITSLLQRTDPTTALLWLTITHAENIAFSPDWYESLSREVKIKLKASLNSNINLRKPRIQLQDCPEFIADWNAEAAFSL